MRLRVLAISLATTLASLLLAASAFAEDGEGLYGETDDRVVTAFGLGLVIFFTIVVIVGTIVQGRLQRRKDAQKAARKRQRIGW